MFQSSTGFASKRQAAEAASNVAYDALFTSANVYRMPSDVAVIHLRHLVEHIYRTTSDPETRRLISLQSHHVLGVKRFEGSFNPYGNGQPAVFEGDSGHDLIPTWEQMCALVPLGADPIVKPMATPVHPSQKRDLRPNQVCPDSDYPPPIPKDAPLIQPPLRAPVTITFQSDEAPSPSPPETPLRDPPAITIQSDEAPPSSRKGRRASKRRAVKAGEPLSVTPLSDLVKDPLLLAIVSKITTKDIGEYNTSYTFLPTQLDVEETTPKGAKASTSSPPGAEKKKSPKKESPAKEISPAARKALIVKRICGRLHSWRDYVEWVTLGERPPSEVTRGVFSTLQKTLVSDKYSEFALAFMDNVQSRKFFHLLLKHEEALAQYYNTLGTAERPSLYLPKGRVFDLVHGEDVGEVVESRPSSQKDSEGTFNPYGNGQWSLSHKARNKLVHALNGNQTRFPRTMDEIRATNRRLSTLYTHGSKQDSPLFDPIDAQTRFSGLQGSGSVISSEFARTTVLTSSYVNRDNTFTQKRSLPIPECFALPAQVGPNNVNGVDSGVLPTWHFWQEIPMKLGDDPILSAQGAQIQTVVERFGNIRAESITKDGFHVMDLISLMRQGQDFSGDSVFPMLFKLWLYEIATSWHGLAENQPMASFANKFDQSCTVAPDISIVDWTYGQNIHPNWNAQSVDLLGNKVNPMTGLIDRVSFHHSIATVPAGIPTYFMPLELLAVGDRANTAINICLFLMAVTNYPCGLFSWRIRVTDNNQPVNRNFLPFVSTVGSNIARDIAIILPLIAPVLVPANQAQANVGVAFTPAFGPTASGPYQANAHIDVSFKANIQNAGINWVNLPDYFYTWLGGGSGVSPIGGRVIASMRNAICNVVKRASEDRLAFELAAYCACRYAPMTVNGARFNVNAAGAFLNRSASGTAYHDYVPVGNYPHSQSDFVIPATSYAWWNKATCGAYTMLPDKAIYPYNGVGWSGVPGLLSYCAYTTRLYAATFQSLYVIRGYPTDLMNVALDNCQLRAVTDVVRGDFVSTNGGGGNALWATNGYANAVLHEQLTGFSPATDLRGCTIYDLFCLPPAGYLSDYVVAGAARLGLSIPQNLPDVWLQLQLKENVLALTPLLSPGNQLMGLPFEAQAFRTGAQYYAPQMKKFTENYIYTDAEPELVDEYIFNMRLAVTVSDFVGVRDFLENLMPGTVGLGQTLQPGIPPVDQWMAAPINAASHLAGSTLWMPFVTTDGKRTSVAIATNQGDSQLLSQLWAGNATTGVAAWDIGGGHFAPLLRIGPQQSHRIARASRALKDSPASAPAPGGGDVSVVEMDAS